MGFDVTAFQISIKGSDNVGGDYLSRAVDRVPVAGAC